MQFCCENAILNIYIVDGDAILLSTLNVYIDMLLFERFIQLGKHVKINISITGAFG